MASCPVDKSITFNCAALQQGGVISEVLIFNYSNWRNATVTVDGGTNEITNITLTDVGAAAYKWEVPKSSNLLPTHALRPIDGVDGYDHSLDLRLASIEQLDQENIARIRFNKVVVIVKLLDGRKLLVGASINATPSPVGVGMRLSEDDGNISDPSTGGTSHFIAKTPESDPPEINKPHLIAAAFDVDALLIPVP